MEKQFQDTARRRKRFTLFMLAAVAPLLMGSLCCGSLNPSNFSGSTHTTTGTLATTGFDQLHMFDANDGWASSNSAIMKTVDGGHTWIDVTPTDWEPLPTTATPDTTNQDKGITATSFFDMNHAWMVSDTVSADDTAATINAAVTINASSTNTTNVQIPQTSTAIVVRSTVDGGATWMSSNTITVTNLVAVYPPSFINDVEGWMELTFTTKTQVSSNSNNSDANDLVVIFHSVDGGITWTPIVPKTFSQFTHNILNEDGIKTGLTMTPYCTTPASALPACSSYKSNNVATTTTNQGCSVTGSTNTLGWATAATPQKIYTEQTTDSARSWSAIGGNAPGGIPKQNNNSQVVVSPPTMFPDGNGILPVQVQSDPDGNDPSYFYLHLYDIIYNLGHQFVIPASYGPTTTFAVDPIYSQQVLSAPDIKHVFVIGQAPKANKDSNGDTIYGDWNLYEFNGGSWQMISSQADATIPTPAAGQQAAMLKGGTLSNLDFISDTEGFATDGTNFYHITLNNNVATWSQVYPPATSTTASSPSTPVDVIREPGTVVPTAHPGPCTIPTPTPTHTTTANPPSKHLLTGYWQDFTNGSTAMRLSAVNPNYNLIAVAFANADPTNAGGVTFSIDSGLSSALGGYNTGDFINDVATLHSQGKKVIISVGGQNGAISVNDATSATNFANSVYDLMKLYGFDGVDIDLENGINPTYMSSALEQLSSKAGSSLIITLAPQTVDMQSTSGDYFQLALDIKSILTIVNMQYYNSGTMLGADGKVYAEGTEDFSPPWQLSNWKAD